MPSRHIGLFSLIGLKSFIVLLVKSECKLCLRFKSHLSNRLTLKSYIISVMGPGLIAMIQQTEQYQLLVFDNVQCHYFYLRHTDNMWKKYYSLYLYNGATICYLLKVKARLLVQAFMENIRYHKNIKEQNYTTYQREFSDSNVSQRQLL